MIEELKGRLKGEEKQLLEALEEAMFSEGCCTEKSMFLRGYNLGVLMTMEIFEDYDSYLGKG